jgi:hypothetical protein
MPSLLRIYSILTCKTLMFYALKKRYLFLVIPKQKNCTAYQNVLVRTENIAELKRYVPSILELPSNRPLRLHVYSVSAHVGG